MLVLSSGSYFHPPFAIVRDPSCKRFSNSYAKSKEKKLLVEFFKNASAQKTSRNLHVKDFKLLTLQYSNQILSEIFEHIFRKHGFTETNFVVKYRSR